jgi:Domain of unknown function (DUF4198)
MIKPTTFAAIFSLCMFSLFTNLTHAHGRYILPSHTLLSGKDPQDVTLSASISNDIFHPDKPLGNNGGGKVNTFLESIFQQLQATITMPDGSQSEDIHWRAYARQSLADIKLEQSGTYKISFHQSATPLTTFKTADGEKSRVFGNNTPLPTGATDVIHHTVASRVETYISHNAPNQNALKSTGQGLELIPHTHPNDLFVGEDAEFQLLLDGKPVSKGTLVNLTREGTRHRNQRETAKIETDGQGRFQTNFTQSGFYLLEIEFTAPGQPGSEISFHHHSLYVTLEVYPE